MQVAPEPSLRTVEHLPDGTLVVLRERGLGKWIHATVRLLWLLGWLAGVIIIGNSLLDLTSLEWRFPAPESMRTTEPGSKPAPPWVVFVVTPFWLAWTLIGVASFVSTIRLLFGTDRITMGPRSFHSVRRIGPFGIGRDVQPADVEWIGVGGKARTLLLAGIAGKDVILSSLGTEDDRRWLARELRSRYGLKTPVEALAGKAPPRWVVSTDPAGTTVLSSRLTGSPIGCFVLVAIWWILFAMVLYARSLSDAGMGVKIGDIVWVALGLGFLAIVVILHRATVRIEVRANELVHTRAVGPWKRQNVIRNGALRVTFHRMKQGSDFFELEVGRLEPWIRLDARSNASAEIVGLGQFLAARTGWALDVVPQARPD